MNSSWMPKVSIIIPVYNGANYMREAINSALSQTYQNVEIVVVNDGSTDAGETERIALEYGDRIRYFKKENGGVSSALNFGVAQMSGEYFSWLSHDDVYSPEKIQHQIESLRLYGDVDSVALCAHCFINADSDRLTKQARKRFPNGRHTASEALYETLKNGSFCGCSFLLPYKVFDDLGGFDEDLRFSQDYLMWVNIFLNGYNLVYCDNEDVSSRIHNKQLTQKGRTVFESDSLAISRLLIPKIAEISSKDQNYLYLYAKRNAKYGLGKVVCECKKAASKNMLFELKHTLALNAGLMLGKIRPFFRMIYYKYFVRIG